jgi:hypothetical protein
VNVVSVAMMDKEIIQNMQIVGGTQDNQLIEESVENEPIVYVKHNNNNSYTIEHILILKVIH